MSAYEEDVEDAADEEEDEDAAEVDGSAEDDEQVGVRVVERRYHP